MPARASHGSRVKAMPLGMAARALPGIAPHQPLPFFLPCLTPGTHATSCLQYPWLKGPFLLCWAHQPPRVQTPALATGLEALLCGPRVLAHHRCHLYTHMLSAPFIPHSAPMPAALKDLGTFGFSLCPCPKEAQMLG